VKASLDAKMQHSRN